MSTTGMIANGKLRARRRNRAVRKKIGEATQGAALLGPCRTNSHRGSTDFNPSSYPPVEAIARAFRVLRTVNTFHIATVRDIFSETQIPKPTIVRVLDTLISEGYVARDNLCGGYRVTARAGELASGYNGISRIIEIARPIVVDLTKRTQWPVGIGTLDNDAICVRFSTAALCKRANAVSLGWRLDLFYSAMGRAYLAFCSHAERERIFKARIAAGLSTRADEAKIRALLPQIREKGYASRAENRTVVASSAAAPLFKKNTLIAVINLSYFKDAVTAQAFNAEIAKPLLEARDRIEAAIEQEQRQSSRSKSAKIQARPARVTPIRLEDNLSRIVN